MNNAQENEIAHAILTRAIDLRRFAAGQVQQVLRLLRDMSDELRARLARDDLTEYGRRDLQRLFSQANETITGYYADIDSHMADQLLGLGRSEADFTAGAMDRAFFGSLGVQLPTEGYFASLLSDNLIMGAPSAAWWDRQAGDAAFRFANEVRLGLAQAETVDQITRRVRDNMQPAIEGNARALVQTSVQQVSADARRATFKRNDDIVEGIQQISTLDSHTSLVCVAYSGATFTLDGDPIPPTTLPYNGGVPRHFNCRSVEVPLTKDLGLGPSPSGTRASDLGQINADTTMTEFIRMRGPAFADQLLGVGRAQLFLDGKITLTDLLDQSGRPLSLKDLNELAR